MSRGSIAAGLAMLLCLACSGGPDAEPTSEQPPSEDARRQADSALAESAIPGARGVRGAMNAADSAAARNARLDSLASEP